MTMLSLKQLRRFHLLKEVVGISGKMEDPSTASEIRVVLSPSVPDEYELAQTASSSVYGDLEVSPLEAVTKDIMRASQDCLAKDWMKPEEKEAWKDL